jgi:hypothetical protein
LPDLRLSRTRPALSGTRPLRLGQARSTRAVSASIGKNDSMRSSGSVMSCGEPSVAIVVKSSGAPNSVSRQIGAKPAAMMLRAAAAYEAAAPWADRWPPPAF